MSESSVAYRYAKSLIELAEEKGITEKVQGDMKLFESVCKENRQFELTMKSPVVKHFKKLEILKAIFADKVDPLTMSIFEIITHKNRERILPALASEFLNQYDDLKGILKAEITTVGELTADQRKSFVDMIAGATGKTVSLKEKTNADLIGGYILKVNDKQIDTSVRKKLNNLKVSFA